MAELEIESPFDGILAKWETFTSIDLDAREIITQIRHALEAVFGYDILDSDKVKPKDVDDFASCVDVINKLSTFIQNRPTLRAAYRYVNTMIPNQKPLQNLNKLQDSLMKGWKNLTVVALDPIKLVKEIINPYKEFSSAYLVVYLQAFDQVASSAESGRQAFELLEDGVEMHTLQALSTLPQIGITPLADIQACITHARESLFPAHLTRAKLEADLREMPQPPGIELSLENAEEWINKANELVSNCKQMITKAIEEKGRLLISPVFQGLLLKGKEHGFIANLLKTRDASQAAELLTKELGSTDTAQSKAKIDLLKKYLVKVVIRRLKLNDFKPAKTSFEKEDINTLTDEFKHFIESQFKGTEGEKIIIEWID